MCLGTLSVASEPGPPEHEKYYIDISFPRCSKTQYMTRISHCMQKHKFGVICLGALFVVSAPGPIENENSASMFHTPDTPKCTT
jgi:hypothetical protein